MTERRRLPSRRPYPRDNVERLPVARIVRDDNGWFVVTHRGHGWLFGDRQAALAEKHWLDRQWRGRL
jgi:hypothetical protein